MRSSRWSENFTREAVFQLHRLTLDEDLLGAGRRPIGRTVERIWHFDLLLDVGGLVLGSPRNDARIAERCAEERAHREHKQDAADDWNGRRYPLCQERTARRKTNLCLHGATLHPKKTHSNAKNSPLVPVMSTTVK